MKKYWEFKNIAETSAELFIYGDISSYEYEGSTSANLFKKELDSINPEADINIFINSPGGEVFEGIAIGNMIKRRKGKTTCTVDALAASIATVIAASCDKVYMYRNSMFMIHNASSIVWGNANEMRKMADDLDRITESIKETYLEKCKKKTTKAEFTRLMDNETWLSADETKELGLCDKVLAENKAVASINSELFKNYKNVPEGLTKPFFDAQKPVMSEETKALLEEVKAMKGYENFDKLF